MKNILIFGALLLLAIPAKVMSQSLKPADFREKIKKEKGILIDVRTAEEYNAERIEGAINIDVNADNFKSEVSKLEKSKSYFLYCGIGKRSAKALYQMKELGFEKVYDLEKGLGEWKSQGFPTIKGN